MHDRDDSLKHLPFFEELAAADEQDASWRAISAGLVVLRLLDNLVQHAPSAPLSDAWAVRAVRATVEDVEPRTPVRAILESVVDQIASPDGVDMHTIAPRLMAYARALEYEARWSLAADVYRTVIEHTSPAHDPDFVIDAYIRLGVCLRELGELTESAAAYAAGGDIAAGTGNLIGVLRARIGDAKVAIQRGNLPRGEELLDRTIEDASAANLRGMHASALHERAHVAALRGDNESAARLAYEALSKTDSSIERDRLLGDIASAFVELGVYSAAIDAYLVLIATAQEQYVRWTARLNLLDVAGRTGVEPMFEQYRRELATEDLPPLLAVHYNLYVAHGYATFGDQAIAQRHLERAVALANEHKFNQLAFEAEAALAALRRARPRAVQETPATEAVSGIARSLREMRELAHASS